MESRTTSRMARRASDEYQDWRDVVLASPWVKEVSGEVQCRASAGYVPKKHRGDPVKEAAYRCQKLAKFRLKATVTRSMLTVDAVSGNYCPLHLMREIENHEGERARFERWFEKQRG